MTDDLARQIASGTYRIQRVENGERVLWIKRPETLTGLMRVLKGDPQKAFQAEIAAHQTLLDKGFPVPPIVSIGPDHIVTEDMGRSVWQHIRTPGLDEAQVQRILVDAAKALAAWHGAGAAHGRPNLKDIVWNEGRVVFLDFERTGRQADLKRAQEMDVLMFLFSVCAETHGSTTAMTSARDAYAAEAPDIWQRAVRRHNRYKPLRFLLWPIVKLRPDKRDFAAIKPFFAFMAG